MLLWYVIAICFVGCALAYYLWQGIDWMEAIALFIVAGAVFQGHLHSIYERAATDKYIISGYVTSVIHRPMFTYKCGKRTCREPERWILEQRPQPPSQQVNIRRGIHGNAKESCQGECRFLHPAPFAQGKCCEDVFAFTVTKDKYARTRPGDTSALWMEYFNPVRISDDVIYAQTQAIPYFPISDYNRAQRFIAPGVTRAQQQRLESLNSELSRSNISAGIIVTDDKMYFERLKRAWHQGKANDFVVVVTTTDGSTIANVNVLGWNNYNLRENVAGAVMALPRADNEAILEAVENALRQGPPFMLTDFKRYKFLSVKIPANYYARIFIYQIALFAYLLFLLRLNPNTKSFHLPWRDVAKMWRKGFHPPQNNWYLHPFTPTGFLLYLVVPVIAVNVLWAF